MRELSVMTIPYGGTDWTALFHEIFPALVFGKSIHRVTPFEEASALAALVHEVVGEAFLLAFADGPNGLCAGCAANGFAGRRQALHQVVVAADALKYIVGEAVVIRAAA